ncbi:MAG: tetratricopeptide repeat protein [Saprospiraceae bacterium]
MKNISNKKLELHNSIQGDISNVNSVDIGDKKYYITNQEKPIPKALTNNIPLLSKEKIIGRDAYFDKLHEILNEKKDAVLVNGFGGVGKTTIAQVYAHTYWGEYAHVAWITLNSDDFIFEMVNAPGLRESLNISAEGTHVQQLFSRMMVEINRISEKPNLLILDNAVEKLSQFKSYLPSTHEWHILVTAREEINGFTSHYLDFLVEDDAIALFKHYYTPKILTDDQITQLVKKVEYHTLTIEILAKTAQIQRFNFETLIVALQNDIKSGVQTLRSGQVKIEKITDYLSSIFSLSELNENEIWVLKNMFCLPSDYHSYDLLTEVINHTSLSKEDVFSETLTSLAQKSWLLYNEDTDSYKMHIVVAEVLKKKEIISFDDISGLVNKLSSLLHLDQNVDNPVDKFSWLPISQTLSSKINEIHSISNDDEITISVFLSNLGIRLRIFGDFNEAKRILIQAMKTSEKHFGNDSYQTAITYSNLACVLQDLGDFYGAKELMTLTLSIYEKHFGADHPSLAIGYSNLGIVHQYIGDIEGAKTLLKKSVDLDEKTNGVNHPATAVGYSNLALVYRDFKDYEGAKILMSKALASDENNFGLDHPNTANSYSNMALILKDLGDNKGAKTLLSKAIDSNEKNFGFDHPATSKSYFNLATVIGDMGDFDEAKILFEKSLALDEKNFGFEHPSTALNYFNLAIVLNNLNEIQQAFIFSKKALDIYKITLPTNHPQIKIVEDFHYQLKS